MTRPLPSAATPPARRAAPRARTGMALPTALLLLVVMTALAGGAFSMSRQAFRGGRNALVEARAFAASEYGLNRQIAEWNPTFNLPTTSGGAAQGQSFISNIYVPTGSIDTATVRITRLDPALFFIESLGRASIPNPQLQSTRNVAALVRLAYPSINPQGAITTNGNVRIDGNAFTVDGRDRAPFASAPGAPIGLWNPNGDAWNPNRCTDLTSYAPVFAFAVPPDSAVSVNSSTVVPGSMGVLNTAVAANPNTYIAFGTETMATLIGGANKWYGGPTVLPDALVMPDVHVDGRNIEPRLDNGRCDFADRENWGEPLGGADDVVPCQGYFPIIFVNGNARINGNGRGQGILIVNGDLQFNGNFTWAGLILVRDDMNKGNGNAVITGAVMAGNRITDQRDDGSTYGGSQTVQYSRCAVESALRGSAALIRVRERGWTQLF
ncbi:MAG TPA: hypothetical protein VEZ47_13415 [Gemmatirosa sp.]|jgi:hypothetical protein|nr:hypothetical protein [Gemmatirosa sp.]